jgi:hypothetical protein
MIMIALQSGRSMEEIGKLIEMRNNEIARLAHLKFIEAKKHFQELVNPVSKNRNVNFTSKDKPDRPSTTTNYNYADLGNVELSIKSIIGQCGFTYDWKTRYEGADIYVTCYLKHVDGHVETDTMKNAADSSGGKNGIQANSSTVTYLRRYTLLGILGLSTEDNDGRKAKDIPPDFVETQFSVLKRPTQEQYNVLMRAIMAGKATVDESIKHYFLTDDEVKALRVSEQQAKHG